MHSASRTHPSPDVVTNCTNTAGSPVGNLRFPLGGHPRARALRWANASLDTRLEYRFQRRGGARGETCRRERSHIRVVDYTGNAAALEYPDRLRLTNRWEIAV